MIRQYVKIALLAMAMLCSINIVAQDRFVKFVTQAALPLGGCSGLEGGVGVNLGHNNHKLNLQVTANYASLRSLSSESEEESDSYYSTMPDDGVGVRYKRLSVPVELHWRSSDDELGSLYLLAGGVYNLNFSGECLWDSSSEHIFALNDGLNRHSFAARLGAGIAMYISDNVSLGAKAYLDINITSPIRKYSISDRLFEYQGSIEDAFDDVAFVLAGYLTF